MRRLKALVPAFIMFAGSLLAAPVPKEAKRVIKPAGVWKYESQVAMGGKPCVVGNRMYRFDEDGKLSVSYDGENFADMEGGSTSWVFDPNDSTVEMVYPRNTLHGIYKVDGDQLVVCHEPWGGDRPTTFEPGKRNFVTTYKRAESK